ncbi:MAG TPA: hypothetical protein VKQ08_06570, partial [Cyclobacteriaceae bacterium]|nr:hypothetical protein [Cyclobacteriaceae bacterium]
SEQSEQMQRLEACKNARQNLYNELVRLDLGLKITMTEIFSIAITGSQAVLALLEKKLASETPKIGRFRMRPSELIRSLELPSFETLNNIVEDCRANSYGHSGLTLVNGKLEIDKSEVAKMMEGDQLIAFTKEQENYYNAEQKALRALNELDQAGQAIDGSLVLDQETVIAHYFTKVDGKWVATNLFERQQQRVFQEKANG